MAASSSDRIVCATPADLAYVVDLQKRNSEAIGFLSRVALQEKIERKQVHLALENDAPAGFLHHGSLARPEVRIFQAAIQYDARRRHHGMMLVQDLIDRATKAGAQGISLRCLDYLDANDFWTVAGFEHIGTEPGGKGLLNVWTKTLQTEPADVFRFHSRIHPCPKCGKPTTDTWTRGGVRRRLCVKCVPKL